MDASSAPQEPTLPPPTLDVAIEEDAGEDEAALVVPVPPLQETLSDCGDHELTLQKQRVRRKRAVDGASKQRQSERLAAKEQPQFEDAVATAAWVKPVKLDLTSVSTSLA
ncbi:hypothetical protein PR202_gb24230 [Eleusine coracana subsp. coracana]|uniref:Uncharacterized protein n=1 Tax=Eleusine coracana subsp. coracana TaxID=191504 RepID=A0AAV5FL13_ELECO|nr:hypothetical protein PR202_gb24230 [Eleusine coracana subsp. coracana]